MSEDLRLEQRLKDFYDRVPDIEDALPFKDYLLKHEDSRMAWYLLGKQYAAKGQEAKANYCFAQAGDIYEAFESKPPIPVLMAGVAEWGRRRGRKRWPAAAAVLLLGAAMLFPGAKAGAPGHVERGESLQITGGGLNEDRSVVPSANSQASISQAGIISAAADANKDGRHLLGELLLQKADRMDETDDGLVPPIDRR